MPAYRATAVVLRKTKLGEADTIVTMLSSDGHQIRAVAKGVRRSGSKIGARLEPFAVVDLLLHSGRNLDVVTEVSTSVANSGLREDLDRTVAASVVADVLDKATADADAEPILYELGLATLAAMKEAASQAQPALVAAFLLKAMSLLGLQPTLTQCARCGCETDGGSAAFSRDHGGMLCATCVGIDEGAAHVSPDARLALSAMLGATMVEAERIQMSADARDECLRLLVAFTRHHIASRLRSLDYLMERSAEGTWPSVDPPSGVG